MKILRTNNKYKLYFNKRTEENKNTFKRAQMEVRRKIVHKKNEMRYRKSCVTLSTARTKAPKDGEYIN